MLIRSLRREPHARHWLAFFTLLSIMALGTASTVQSAEQKPESEVTLGEKRVIGATETVEEVKTDLLFKARVDTGATSSSLHVEDYVIEDEAEEMSDNVGKKIRFRIKNHDGESEWLESKIARVTVVKTSVDQEERYKVHLTLRLHQVQKRVLVTLNDRSHMKYPMLLGRNFLRGDFVVDVDSKKARKEKANHTSEQEPSPVEVEKKEVSQGSET